MCKTDALTTELYPYLCSRSDSNRQPSGWKPDALTLELLLHIVSTHLWTFVAQVGLFHFPTRPKVDLPLIQASLTRVGHLLRRWDSNPRPGEYEPPELTTALPRNIDLPVGLEPTTFSLQGRCSAKLSYRRISILGASSEILI